MDDPSFRHFEYERLSVHTGAKLTGIDPRNVSEDVTAELIRALDLFHVVVIPAAVIEDKEHVEFAKKLGSVISSKWMMQLPRYRKIEGCDGLQVYSKTFNEAGSEENYAVGSTWHIDMPYLKPSTSYTILQMKEIDEGIGDTLFSNQYLAFDSLSEGMKDFLRNTNVVFRGTPYPIDGMDIKTFATSESVQPAVRVHPRTGKEALFIAYPYFPVHLEGFSQRESDSILRPLLERGGCLDFVIRVRWKPGYMTLYDNRAVLHRAINDHTRGIHKRVLRRIAVQDPEEIVSEDSKAWAAGDWDRFRDRSDNKTS